MKSLLQLKAVLKHGCTELLPPRELNGNNAGIVQNLVRLLKKQLFSASSNKKQQLMYASSGRVRAPAGGMAQTMANSTRLVFDLSMMEVRYTNHSKVAGQL